MDMGLRTWLFLFFFCVCSIQGLEQKKKGTENLGEKGKIEQKPDLENSEEEGQEQEKPEMQTKKKGQVLQKPEIKKPEEKGQVPQKLEIQKPEKKGQAPEKPAMQKPNEKGSLPQKPEKQKPKENGQVLQKPEIRKPDEKDEVQQKLEMQHKEETGQVSEKPKKKKPKKKDQVQQKLEMQHQEETGGQVSEKPKKKKPKKKDQAQQKLEMQHQEETGQVSEKPKKKKPKKKDQVQQKLEMQHQEEIGQVPGKPEMQKPKKKDQVQQKLEMQHQEEIGQVPEKPEIKKPKKKDHVQQKLEMEHQEETGQVPEKPEIQKPKKKDQVQQKQEMQHPEKTGQVPEKPKKKKPKKKGQVPGKPEMQKPEEKGHVQQKQEMQHPEETGQVAEEAEIQKPKKKVPEKQEIQNPKKKGQVQQKLEMQHPEETDQVPEKPEIQKPKKKSKVPAQPEMQQPEKTGQVQEKPEMQQPEETGQVQQKPEMQQLREKATVPHPRCLEKFKIGPCKKEKKRYWFNGKECVKFMWGGCEPSGNNFKSRCSCERKCLGRDVPCECYKPKKVGPCKAEIPRWWFNGRKCKKFVWGGCESNGNNFKTKRQCKETCAGLIKQKAKMNTTNEKGAPGVTLQKAPKYRLEIEVVIGPTQQKAEANNLEGKGQEQSRVAGEKVEERGQGGKLPSECYEPKSVGRCRAAIPRWWYDGRRCQQFVWGGCNPNGNNFKTKQQCEEKCGAPPPNCVDPLKAGPCKAAIPRFWFDGRQCKRFLWGGCAPNGNNFRNKLLCEKACIGKTPPHTCVGPRKRGPCPAAIRRWWFDGARCKEFIYGGCAPNGNNYKTKEECEITCAPPPPNCVDPLKTGPCKAAIPRFWFDGLQCKRFLWGGCFPNGNNFRNKLLCERTCIGRKRPKVCTEPLKPGPCEEAIPRWWFNGYQCLEFMWGGCAPNGNNFKTRAMCQRKCLGERVSKARIGAEK